MVESVIFPAPAPKASPGLPSFIQQRATGVFVVVANVPSEQKFREFVDELFAQGSRFSGLDYEVFQQLAFPVAPKATPVNEVCLASEIVAFPSTRKALYKECRVMDKGARAEYMFEPVFLEVAYEDPIYGEPDADGQRVITGHETKTRAEPTQLDFDEFVADLWGKGVQFGIDAKNFAIGCAKSKTERLVVANELKPTPGSDAELKEECKGLHRDDSPMIVAGKADLGRFKNRFPQMTNGQRMMCKIPRRMGIVGYKVSGLLVEPEIPKDIDLEKISGPGTKIELLPDGQHVVAVIDGFMSIDVASNLISVTEKIENREGISAKTTGDLSLTVEEFVEHGEVQEGRTVDGKHMKFTSAVYGALVSSAGRIALEDNLIGGSAISAGGSIVIKKRASNAYIEAVGGSIEVNYAENSQIIGQNVRIGQAINCDIVAEVLRMDSAQGCSIAARSTEIHTAGNRKDDPTVLSVLVPDPQEFIRRTAELDAAMAQTKKLAEVKLAEVNRVKTNPEVAKMLAIKEMVQAGKIQFAGAQEENFRQMQTRLAPLIKVMERLLQEWMVLTQAVQEKHQQLESFKNEQVALSQGRGVKIVVVVGSTLVQQMLKPAGAPDFNAVSGQALHNVLSAMAPLKLRVLAADHGSVDWQYGQ